MLEMCINMLPQHSVIFNGCDISNTNFLNKIYSFIKNSIIPRFRQRIFCMYKEAISAQDKKLTAI